ncbi:MAG: hypothetical protein Q9204_000002 [Flavoplaca sp. TL-2023a]
MEAPNDPLNQILRVMQSLKDGHQQLTEDVLSIKGRLEVLAHQQCHHQNTNNASDANTQESLKAIPAASLISSPPPTGLEGFTNAPSNSKMASPQRSTATSQSSRIILTTYPGQAGIDPVPMNWGHHDRLQRGPVIVSRSQSSIKRRNAIGAHGGSYSVYHALAIASKNLDVDYRPDFTNSEPAINLGPFPQWADAKKIVSLDPLGHLSPWLFDSMIRDENIHIRPTIAITKAHMKLPELEQSVRFGRLKPDGKICLSDTGELAVTKFAVEPVWFLPGVAERFGIDMKLFLPPIGGLTVYCFGDPSKMSDPNVKLALRIHDECNGSDVFGSDICTCRPYLIFGVEEAVKEAQHGGSGVVVYFRKEGRALGEVTKYLVYNASE